MKAKDELFERIKYLNAAADLDVVKDSAFNQIEHNGVANILRKGLSIIAFNTLEDFITKRTKEALAYISTTRVLFENLPDKLQDASLIGALKVLLFRAKIEKKANHDWQKLIRDEAFKVYSTGQSSFELSEFSLGSSNSNISVSDISEILKSFGILTGWQILKQISDTISGGIPDLAQAYKNAAERRHSSAHMATFNYNYQWLSDIKREILAITASFDISLSARCRQIQANPTIKADLLNLQTDLIFRFLEKNGSKYRECSTIGGRARKVWNQLDDAIDYLQPKLVAKKQFIIVLDESKRITDWFD